MKGLCFCKIRQSTARSQLYSGRSYLLVTNSKLALRLLVLVGESLEALDRLAGEDGHGELDVGLGVLVAGLEQPVSLSLSNPYRTRVNVRKPSYHQAKPPASRSKPCASRPRYPRRTFRNLKNTPISLPLAIHSMKEPRTSMEQRISRKHDLVPVILHKPTDAVLGVTRRVEALDGDILADLEALSVAGRLGHAFTVLAADDGELGEA
jgi:hypothetical protein